MRRAERSRAASVAQSFRVLASLPGRAPPRDRLRGRGGALARAHLPAAPARRLLRAAGRARNLEARTDAMATLVGNQIDQGHDARRTPPVLQYQERRPRATRPYERSERTEFVAQPDAERRARRRQRCPSPGARGAEPVYTLDVPAAGRCGRARARPGRTAVDHLGCRGRPRRVLVGAPRGRPPIRRVTRDPVAGRSRSGSRR